MSRPATTLRKYRDGLSDGRAMEAVRFDRRYSVESRQVRDGEAQALRERQEREASGHEAATLENYLRPRLCDGERGFCF